MVFARVCIPSRGIRLQEVASVLRFPAQWHLTASQMALLLVKERDQASRSHKFATRDIHNDIARYSRSEDFSRDLCVSFFTLCGENPPPKAFGRAEALHPESNLCRKSASRQLGILTVTQLRDSGRQARLPNRVIVVESPRYSFLTWRGFELAMGLRLNDGDDSKWVMRDFRLRANV